MREATRATANDHHSALVLCYKEKTHCDVFPVTIPNFRRASLVLAAPVSSPKLPRARRSHGEPRGKLSRVHAADPFVRGIRRVFKLAAPFEGKSGEFKDGKGILLVSLRYSAFGALSPRFFISRE